MNLKLSSITNWLSKIFNTDRKSKLWHFFPSGNELNIKSMLEILIYVILILGGFYLYVVFNRVDTDSYVIRVENLDSKDINLADSTNFVNDTILTHISNIKFYLPYKNDLKNRERPVFLPIINIPYLKTDTSKLCHGDISFGFWSEHSLLRNKEQKLLDNKSNDSIFDCTNYHVINRFFKRKFNFESFNDSIWINSLLSYKVNEVLTDYYPIEEKHDTIKNFNHACNELFKIYDNIEQGTGAAILFSIIKNNYKEKHDISNFFSKNDYVFKILNDKRNIYKKKHEIIYLKNYFFDKLKDSIGENKFIKLTDNERYPLNYYSVSSSKYKKREPNEGWLHAKTSYANYQKVQIDSIKGSFSQWIQGQHEAPGFLNKAFIEYQFGNPIFWTKCDISKRNFHFDLESSTIDSINFIIDFGNVCEFSMMDPMPDVITKSSIEFNDQWKILQIKEKGLDFYVKFVELENLQGIRLFIIQAVISGLLIILISFLIIGSYKVFKRKKKQLPVNMTKRTSLLETYGIFTDIIDNL